MELGRTRPGCSSFSPHHATLPSGNTNRGKPHESQCTKKYRLYHRRRHRHHRSFGSTWGGVVHPCCISLDYGCGICCFSFGLLAERRLIIHTFFEPADVEMRDGFCCCCRVRSPLQFCHESHGPRHTFDGASLRH